MSKKKRSAKPPKLSASQSESPESLSSEEVAARRQRFEAETSERNRRQGHELLAEGARLLTLRRPGEAAEKLEGAAVLLPDNVDVAINLGGAYILQNRYNRAVPILERASQLAPDNAMVWVNLAAAYLGRLEISGPQRQDQAIEAYTMALAINAATPNVNYNLGLIYKDRRDWRLAHAHFAQALQVDPTDRDARYWLDELPSLERAAAAARPHTGATSDDAADAAGDQNDSGAET